MTSPKIACLLSSHGVGAERDEELAAVGVGAGVGHRQEPAAIVAQAGAELVGELVAGAARAVAHRAAALDHEAVDDAVEDQAVVEGRFTFWPVFGSVHSLVPSARPTKLATVFGALSSKSLTLKVPSEVSNVAVVMRNHSNKHPDLACVRVALEPSRRSAGDGPTAVYGGPQVKGLVTLDVEGKPAASDS